jgi:hypothetical protein
VQTVHVFVAHGRFRTLDDVHAFVDQTYTDDGDEVTSPFMLEIGLSSYEPMSIETRHSARPVPLVELLRGASYGDQWLSQLDSSLVAESAICVFSPNEVAHPERSSLEYVGSWSYQATAGAPTVQLPR